MINSASHTSLLNVYGKPFDGNLLKELELSHRETNPLPLILSQKISDIRTSCIAWFAASATFCHTALGDYAEA